VATTVALTGASGFVGARIAERLVASGLTVRALRHRRPLPAGLDGAVDTVAGGLDDEAALARLVAGVDAVVHCAALLKSPRAAAFHDTNALGVRRLARAALRAPHPPRLLVMSSLAAREPHLSPYARSKHDGEREIEALGDRLRWTVFRPPGVYGPGDRETLPILRWLRRGVAFLPAGGAGRVSLIHVDDLASAALAWVDAETAHGSVYEIDDGRVGGYTWDSILEVAAAELGVSQARIRPPPVALYTVIGVADWFCRLARRTPGVTSWKLRELAHPDWVCRDRRLGRDTGWEPRFDLVSGLRHTVGWYRAAGWL